jgi:hypothetical protein
MRVRRLIRVLHRDFGYFLAGLVVFYCVSGVAVNHIDDWNPSYSTSVTPVALGPLEGVALDALEREVVVKAGLDTDDVAGRHRPDPRTIVVFLPHGGEARVDIATGEGTIRRVWTRPFLFESNVLHLNHLKGVWTWVADAFAVLLLGLAITGLFMLKGRTGLGGRGKWFVSAGILLPLAFLVYYYATR